MLGVAAVFTQLHREITAGNARDGMAPRARLGRYTGPTNNPRHGYAYSKEEGKLLVGSGKAKVVQRVFEPFARQK
jgi:hypothetical protein